MDIVAGTSIGAVNAPIIVGSKGDHPEKHLEEFWLEIAESNYKIIPDIYLSVYDSRNQRYTQKRVSSASLTRQCLVFRKCLFQDGWGRNL